jgi:hypothetical protein
MPAICNTPNRLLDQKGLLYVLDPCAGEYKQVCVVDNIQVSWESTPIDVKTPSGISVLKKASVLPSISFDYYHTADLPAIELLYQGVLSQTYYDGSTTVNRTVEISMEDGCCASIPASSATVNSITSLDGATTYTVSTDYTVSNDTATGQTVVCHVTGGGITAGTRVLVDFDQTPSEGHVLTRDSVGLPKSLDMIVIAQCDCDDNSKFRKYVLPRMTVESTFTHTLIETGDTTSDITPVSVTATHTKSDGCENVAEPYWVDTCYVEPTA